LLSTPLLKIFVFIADIYLYAGRVPKFPVPPAGTGRTENKSLMFVSPLPWLLVASDFFIAG
jgi:hypothetical protein